MLMLSQVNYALASWLNLVTLMNLKIEQSGLDAVIAHEQSENRIVRRVHKCGYDLISYDELGKESRHIEVKTTNKKNFTSRWFEQLEWNCFLNDSLFHLYLVVNANDHLHRKIHIFDKQRLAPHFVREVKHYLFNFSAVDFA